MSTAGELSQSEANLIEELFASGLSLEVATFAVVLLTRRYGRPFDALLAHVEEYAALSDPLVRANALHELMARGWAVEETVADSPPAIVAHPDLKTYLLREVPDFVGPVAPLVSPDEVVSVLGHMGDLEVFKSFARRLSEARSDIAIPLFMTFPPAHAVNAMKECATRGVRVRVLMAEPHLAERVRGGDAAKIAMTRIRAWRDVVRSIPEREHRANFEVRLTSRAEDLTFASSFLTDGRRLRLAIYDNETQRSTDGVMLEFRGDRTTNLARMFRVWFDEAWSGARPVERGEWPRWILGRSWPVAIFAAVSIAACVVLLAGHSGLASLLGGGAVGYAFQNTDRVVDGLRRLPRRIHMTP